MRILWFANSSYIPKTRNGKGYNNSGWIGSLQLELQKRNDIILGLCCLASTTDKFIHDDGTTYYLVKSHKKTLAEKIAMGFNPQNMKYEYLLWDEYSTAFASVVDDFTPDVIHVFGTEFYYGLVAEKTNIPIIVHLQGILNPCFNAILPNGVSARDYFLINYNPKKIWSRYQTHMEWYRRCEREKHIFKLVKNYIGRTEWDKACTEIFNPSARYFYGSEMLRSEFYEETQRVIPRKLVITTTISYPLYKGLDLVLKTANLLKKTIGDDFEWNVYGNVSGAFFERHYRIKCKDVNVNLCGVATSEQLKDALLSSTLYFHPSYIDNSPNSVCEAQILGCPVICTNVGGVSSIVDHDKTGFLIPANDPFMAVYRITKLYKDVTLNKTIGDNGKIVAQRRHNSNTIVTMLLETYNELINNR